MMDYTVTTEMTMTKVKAAMKATVMEEVISFLREKYGDDNVAMVRDKKKNTIGVRIGNIKDGTGEHEGCVTIDVSAKEYTNRKTASKSYEMFDFDKTKKEYDDYLVEKNTKTKKSN